jgi:NAD(P)-dependent dehydrogenase (short-subunit alcohol dehydrogenase family)
VTGGTKGLGRQMVLAFGHAGYGILALYSSDETAAEELRRLLSEQKIKGSVVRHDVTGDDDTVWKLPAIAEAEALVLVHNACAAFSPLPLHQYRWKDFEDNFQVAVKGGWHCATALLRPMLKSGRGTIVTVTTAALEGAAPKGFSAYLTAKHALRGLTLALAAEYSARGVRVFSVSPGFMKTSLTDQWDSRFRDIIQTHSSRVTEPALAAAELVRLVEDEGIAGRGEDHPL